MKNEGHFLTLSRFGIQWDLDFNLLPCNLFNLLRLLPLLSEHLNVQSLSKFSGVYLGSDYTRKVALNS